MPLITLDNAQLAYSSRQLLDGANFILDPNEKVALIGRNGAGKSSLLRVLAKQSALDKGTLWRDKAARLAYVSQEPPLEPEQTVFEAVASGLGELRQILLDYHAVSHDLGQEGTNTDALL